MIDAFIWVLLYLATASLAIVSVYLAVLIFVSEMWQPSQWQYWEAIHTKTCVVMVVAFIAFWPMLDLTIRMYKT